MNIPQVREEMARGGPLFQRPRAYHEEMERRRQQEQEDAELARRMQRADFGLPNRRNDFGVFGVGNARGHFMNDHFVQRATNILNGLNNNQREAAERIVAEIRNRHRVADLAAPAAVAAPVPVPVPVLVPAPAPVPDIPRNAPPVQAPVSVEQPSPLRRSTTTRTPVTRRPTTARRTIPNQEPNAADASGRRPAILAGLNRPSATGRVDAWRQHISGEPVISPLWKNTMKKLIIPEISAVKFSYMRVDWTAYTCNAEIEDE
jgi:hypothetical protein